MAGSTSFSLVNLNVVGFWWLWSLLVATCNINVAANPNSDNIRDPTQFFGSANVVGNANVDYMDWWTERGQNWFDHSIWLPTKNDQDIGVALHWSLDATKTKIHIAVAAKATGWVGFGLSENGGMRGADVVLWEARNPDQVIDAHILDTLAMPLRDACQSWQLDYSFASEEAVSRAGNNNMTTDEVNDARFIIFEATRLIDTGDSQDRKIQKDDDSSMPPTTIIAAWGDDTETYSYHGPNRVQGSVRFFQEDEALDGLEQFRKQMEQEADGFFFVGADNFQVPLVETHYQTFCYNVSHLSQQGVPVEQELHVIGVEPIIDERGRKYVHHFGVAESEPREGILHDNRCDTSSSQQTIQVLYTWAAGRSQPILLPPGVSYPMGIFSYGIQIHYDNVDLDEGKLDSSGVRLYYTSKPRDIDAGVMPLGDAMLKLQGNPLGDGLSKQFFSCPGDCTALTFSGDMPITVYAERYHMHAKGVRATNQVVRNGTVVHSSRVDFWDFDQNGGLLVQQEPFVIQPGDALETTCYFDTPNNGDENYLWGEASQEEMCIVYLFYYPRQYMAGSYNSICNVDFLVPQCSAKLDSISLADVQELGRVFGQEPDKCPEPVEYDRESLANREDLSSTTTATTTSSATNAALFTSRHQIVVLGAILFAAFWV